MRNKIYNKFKPKHHNDTWVVVTDDTNEIIVAQVAKWMKHPKAVAVALSSALNTGKYALEDII